MNLRNAFFALLLGSGAAALPGCGPSAEPPAAAAAEPAAAAPAAEPTPPVSSAAAVATGSAAPATGIDTIRAEDLRAHIGVLASDEYEGRETLKPGYEKAASYIAQRFAEFGLKPMPGRSDFRVSYEMNEIGYDATGTQAAIGAGEAQRALVPGADFSPVGNAESGRAEGDVVFAGYGISAPEIGYDDYEGLDVKGKLVLVLRSQPLDPLDKSKNDPRFPNRNLGRNGNKLQTAARNGALGVLLVTGPRHSEEAEDLRLRARLSVVQPEAPAAGAAPAAGSGPGSGQGGGGQGQQRERTLPALHLSQSAAAALLQPSGRSLLELQSAIDGGKKPRELALAGARAAFEIQADSAPHKVSADDVAGFLEGSDPAQRDEWIVIGSHYDHLGAFSGSGDTVYNGADDNASGTAGMLELAQAFASQKPAPKRSMLFVGFSGEEKGLLGSRALVAQKLIPIEQVVFMINLDMIGRNPDRPVSVIGDGFSSGLGEAVTAANANIGLDLRLGGIDYSGNSDHDPFYDRDVPFAFFFTGTHEDYHQLSDHADKIEYDQAQDAVRVAYGVADRVASGALTPTFIHHIDWLGLALEGSRVSSVESDSRATDAGIEVGDVLLAVNGTDVVIERGRSNAGRSVRDIEPGTPVAFAFERGGARRELNVQRARRGYLGIATAPVEDEERKRLALSEAEGVKIDELTEGSPAAAAGLRTGDIIVQIAGRPVNQRTLTARLTRIGAGEKVTLWLFREDERISIELTLGEPPRPQRG